jgi:uncharacterized membrane protein
MDSYHNQLYGGAVPQSITWLLQAVNEFFLFYAAISIFAHVLPVRAMVEP